MLLTSSHIHVEDSSNSHDERQLEKLSCRRCNAEALVDADRTKRRAGRLGIGKQTNSPRATMPC